MDALGLLRIKVGSGRNLTVRDTASSDPYVVVTCASQTVKTRVEKNSCNPVWNEDLTIYIKDLNDPIIISVYDKDTFTKDDSMGNAQIDIKPYMDCLKIGLMNSLPDGTKVCRVEPNEDNCLSDESYIVWNNGKMSQQMNLKLRNVKSGELEVQIEWIDLPDNQILQE